MSEISFLQIEMEVDTMNEYMMDVYNTHLLNQIASN